MAFQFIRKNCSSALNTVSSTYGLLLDYSSHNFSIVYYLWASVCLERSMNALGQLLSLARHIPSFPFHNLKVQQHLWRQSKNQIFSYSLWTSFNGSDTLKPFPFYVAYTLRGPTWWFRV